MVSLSFKLPPALAELRRFVEFGDVQAFTDAKRFARRYGVSPLLYSHARAANLVMLPPWVDIRSGLVVDIGANEGDWIGHVLQIFPGLRFVAAEPAGEPRAILQARFAGHANATVDSRAVSDAAGTATFHRTRASVFASLLAPTPALTELYALPGGPTDVLETFDVETVTLDELVGEHPVSVLKLDVQGGELAVLRGGRQVLERTAAVLVEVVFVPHYEGDASFADIHEAMTELGYVLMDLAPLFRLDDGPALWTDACYARPPGR
jgi:FkbM family methyltransferase